MDATCWYGGKGGQPSTIVGFQRNPGMVRIRIKKTPRKKRFTWLDEIQAEASRPRASYTPPSTDEASIMKFIHKKAADQRRANVNRMAGVVFGQQALRSYTAAQKKQRRRASRHPPLRKKKPATGLSQHCPESVFSLQTIDLQFLGGTGPSQQTESGPVAIKGPHAPSDEHPHH